MAIAIQKNEKVNPFVKFFRNVNNSKKAYLFLIPLFFFLILFSYYPAFSGIYNSFFDWKDTGEKTFIGFQNYKTFLSDKDVFWPSFINLFKILVPKILINVFIPLIVAELIYNVKNEKLSALYRILILIPIVAPGIVTTLLWEYIYDPNYGLLAGILSKFGVEPIDWLNNTKTVIPAIIFMGFPWIGGTSVLIYIAGLNSISPSIRESAILDGSTGLQTVFKIDLPMIKGQIFFFLINGIISGFQDYSVQFLITNGGPGYETMVPGYYMYQEAFTSGKMGYACAIGTFLFVVIMAFTIFTFKAQRIGDK